MSFLSVSNLSKTFTGRGGEVRALQNISLEVQAGECLAIVGESGSGKSTLANILLGMMAADSGTLALAGEPLQTRRSREQRRAIQLVQQNPLSALNPRRTVGASLRLGLDTYQIGAPNERWQRVEQALIAVGLAPDLRHRSPAGLSGGQRQRVSIARALVCEPRLIVLDEPTSALDVLVQTRVLTLLNQLRQQRGLTYLFISHDLAVVRNIADRVAVFQAGELVELAATEAIFQHPKTAYCRALLAAVPVVTDEELQQRNRIAQTA